MSVVLIGADVGGSKTAVAVSEGGSIKGRALGPGAAVRPGRAIASAATIAETIRKALSAAGLARGHALVVGAAGAGRESERRELEGALRVEALADRIHVTTDIEVALHAAFGDGPGIVVVAGTGSVVMGRDPEGRMLRQGGYGWQMGDEGSGYAIGRAALGAASRARDGRSPETALTPILLEATRSADFDSLVRWAASAGPAEVAMLAPHVLHTAERGDLVAQGIADYAARELSTLVLGLAREFPTGERVGVALMGGMLAEERSLRSAVLAKLEVEPSLRPLATLVDAAQGALAMAARLV
jgi:N-acetylglucosamine kinase-like BadF-type ATPase